MKPRVARKYEVGLEEIVLNGAFLVRKDDSIIRAVVFEHAAQHSDTEDGSMSSLPMQSPLPASDLKRWVDKEKGEGGMRVGWRY